MKGRNMKKLMILSAAFGLMSSVALAEVIELPTPQIDNGATLYQALKDRHSVRSYAKKPIDKQMLSNILWVAYAATSSVVPTMTYSLRFPCQHL